MSNWRQYAISISTPIHQVIYGAVRRKPAPNLKLSRQIDVCLPVYLGRRHRTRLEQGHLRQRSLVVALHTLTGVISRCVKRHLPSHKLQAQLAQHATDQARERGRKQACPTSSPQGDRSFAPALHTLLEGRGAYVKRQWLSHRLQA